MIDLHEFRVRHLTDVPLYTTLDHISIPSRVRIFVWRRDQGRCVECGTNERLEYDHIIPVAKGGSNTARNLQLLCAVCNRKKGPRIG